MMDFGSVISGAGENLSVSAFSSLSASAPPFRVDRLNPNPNLQYSEYPYGSSNLFSHPWQYASPSAPTHKQSVNSISTGTSSMPVSDHYQFSASMPISSSSTYWSTLGPSGKTTGSVFSYGGGVEPYYSTYVCPTFNQDIPLVKDDGPLYDVDHASGPRVSSQNDYVQSLYGLEYGPGWVGSKGFDNVAPTKIDGSFSSENAIGGGSYSCNNQLNGGGRGIEYGRNTKVDTGVSHENFDWVHDKELHTGVTDMRHMEDKSCLEKNHSFLPYESSKIFTSASGSTYPESHKPNYQNSCNTFERSVGSLFTSPTSAIRSSPAVVIRPPPAVNRVLGQNGISRKPARSDTAGSSFGDFHNNNISEQKDLGKKSNSEILESFYDANLFNISKQGNDQTFILSYPIKELSIPQHTDDTFDRNIKARFGSQCHNISGSGCLASVPVVPSTEESSDLIDHHNLAVDSPCWKGAHSSQFSSPDFEDGPFPHIKECLDQFRGFDHEKHENLNSIIDSTRTSSKKAGEAINNLENECARDALGRSLDAIFPSREEGSSENVKPVAKVLNNDPNTPTRESGLPNSLKNGFDMKISNSECFIGEHDFGSLYDGSECGNVAVHAAEKVLISPSSQEDAHTSWIPKLDVSTLIKTMHNLSDMLLCHLSNDVCTLEEESTEILKDIINNLDSCKKSIQTSNASKLNNRTGDGTKKLQEFHNVGAISGSLHMSNDAPDSHNQLDYLHMHEEKSKAVFYSKKDEKLPVCPSLMDDLDTALDDDIAKAMKKVLDENFNFDEEMHPQSLLFKSLWLEAEAKLCSVSYRARFDRMKIEMEKAAHKPPKENKDFVEMTSKVLISPDPSTASTHNIHDSPTPKPQLLNSSFSSKSTGNADNIENSVMTRFNILKSRDDSLNPNTDSIHKAHDNAIMKSPLQNSTFSSKSSFGHADDIGDSVMAKFNVIKSREDNLSPINLEKEQQPETTHGDSVKSVMARFNILKSREENLKPINVEENRAEMGEVGFSDKQFVETLFGDQSEDKILSAALRTHFLQQPGSSGEAKFGSYLDGYGYESLKELNDPIIRSFDESRMMNQDYLGWGDISGSDWEHVQKDDLAWKNL